MKILAMLLSLFGIPISALATNFHVKILPFSKPRATARLHKVLFTLYTTRPSSRYKGFCSMRAMECNADGSNLRSVGPAVSTDEQGLQGYGFYKGEAVTGLYTQSTKDGDIDDTTHQIHPEAINADIYIGAVNITEGALGTYHSGAFIGPSEITFRSFYQGSTKSFLYDGNAIKQIGDQYGYGGQISSLGDLAYHHPNDHGYDLMINNKDVKTRHLWNFVCGWNPCGGQLLFLAGIDNRHADLYLCSRDGSSVYFLATRSNYFGASPLFDNGVDWHYGSSNLPCWINDSSVVYAANEGRSAELYRVDTESGDVTQFTSSAPGSWWANPHMSNDGSLMVVTGCVGGIRNVYATDFKTMWQVTHYKGKGVWQPYAN